MAIVFDKGEKLIIIEAPATEVSVQELYDAIRDWQDELVNMETHNICNAYGKQPLGAGLYVGITLELINDWRVQFEDRFGPGWVACSVRGGNLVAINIYNDDPIKPAAYVNVIIAQASSATIQNLAQLEADASEARQMLENRLEINEATSEWWLYDEAGTSVVKKWPLTDKDGLSIVLEGGGPANRGKRTL